MKKILFLVNVDWFFISHRLPIALKALNSGYDVHIACEFIKDMDYLKNLGFTVHQIPFSRSGTNVFQELRALKQIYRVFNKVKPDIVHGVTIKPVLYGGLITRLLSVPAFVGAISGLGLIFVAKGLRATLTKFLVKLLYKISFAQHNIKIIFQNEVDKNTLISLGIINAKDTVLIKGSGVDLNEYTLTPEPERADKGLVITMAARLLREKGVVEFIDMAKNLKNAHENVRFLLVGEPDFGNPNSFTESDLTRWRQEGFVELVGFCDDIPTLFSNTNIVVLPSYYGEGLPKVLIEAAACGRAVVTTDNPGCSAAVIKNETGIIVPIKDVKALSKAVLLLINDPMLRKGMGTTARVFAEREFDINSVVAKHLNIYRELLDK